MKLSVWCIGDVCDDEPCLFELKLKQDTYMNYNIQLCLWCIGRQNRYREYSTS